ncbi:hypothetical protein [Planobispora longispora]|uniref:Uncharacterized protein n=1 Tax=Planobispora longispora TaxID=28887 RepID=A0A8J3RJH7_9ACTN|nr:hypothetical protein [Planobispora longispora]GIH76094.1 hypothetical protein Plo01_25230 [Planobispora longispora]
MPGLKVEAGAGEGVAGGVIGRDLPYQERGEGEEGRRRVTVPVLTPARRAISRIGTAATARPVRPDSPAP